MSNRKNRSPEEQARRAKIRELLQASNISSMADIQDLFKETIAEFMENGLVFCLNHICSYATNQAASNSSRSRSIAASQRQFNLC